MIEIKGDTQTAVFGRDDMTMVCRVEAEGGVFVLCDVPYREGDDINHIVDRNSRVRFVFPNIGSLVQLMVQLQGLIGMMDEARNSNAELIRADDARISCCHEYPNPRPWLYRPAPCTPDPGVLPTAPDVCISGHR